MDFFQIPDDYKPQKPLTDEQMQDITKYLKNHPLFMKQLPEDISQNQHLVALQALTMDDDPNSTAQGYNVQANQILKKGPDNKMFLKHAYSKYTDAINVKCSDPKINAKIHSNRAQINLKLKNYGKVIIDCKISLKFDSEYTKSYYRYAKALMAVKKYDQVQKLLKDRKQPQLLDLRADAQKQLQKLKSGLNNKSSIMNEKQKQIDAYCKQKSYKILPRTQHLPEGAQIEFDGKSLSIPILFAYPAFGQMDIIAKTSQNQKIKQYLAQLFENPLPWDTNGQYDQANCQIFYQFNQNTLMKIPKQAKIGQVASRITMKGAMQLSIVSKKSKFYQIYLKDKKVI